MKIAIDTHFISSGHATGNRTYIAELVQAMVNLNTQHEFILYAIDNHPYYRQFDGNPNVIVRNVLSTNGMIRNFYSIPKAVANDKPDVVHLLFILPLFIPSPSVLTVHDLFYVHQADIGLYNKAIGKLTKWSIPRATKVVTISEYSKQDILNTCAISDSHILSIPLGIDKKFKPAEQQKNINVKYRIKRDYILYVGRTEDPRKNLPSLIDAYATLRNEGAITDQLVIAGRHGAGTASLLTQAKAHGLGEDILFPGIIDDADLPTLLSNAKIFVYVSSFEGFGLPVAEAMACGTPVITSPVTSLAEVAGDAAIMVYPGNTQDLALAIKHLLNDDFLKETLRTKGLERALRYNWESAARSTIKCYEEATEIMRQTR